MRLLNARARVNVPILPTNIDKMISHFPEILNEAVIPVLKPTVAKADTCSKTKSRISFPCSVIDNKNISTRL